MIAEKLDAKTVVPALTRHVNNVLLATAFAQLKRERVDAIQRRVLAEDVYLACETIGNKRFRGCGERITEPRITYLMRDDHAAKYHDKMQAIHLANGYEDALKGYCPALVAEHLQTEAEWLLIDVAEEFFGVTNEKLLCGTKDENGLECRARYLDLLIKLVVNSPDYVPPEIPKGTA